METRVQMVIMSHLSDIPEDPNNKDNNLLAAAIPPVFKAKEIAENIGVLPYTAFFDPKTGSGVAVKPKKQAKSKK